MYYCKIIENKNKIVIKKEKKQIIFKENEEDNIITVKKTNNKKKVTFKEDEIPIPKENKNILLQAMKNDLFIFMMNH